MNRCKAKSGTNYYNSSHSLSTTIFKIVLRFFENENNYEEASLVLLDIAHKDESKFVNISHLNEYDTKQHMKKKKDIEWQHESLCRMIKGLNIKKKQKNHYHTDFCDLTVLLKYYIFGEEKIVMISNINPDVEEAEENLKVLYMSTMFKNGIKMIEQINTKPFRLQKFSLNKRMKEMIKFNRLIKEKKGKEKNSTSEDDNFTNNKGIVRDKSYDKIENSYNKWDKDIPIHNDTHEDNEKNLLNSEKSQELSPIRLINDKDLKENIIKKDDKMTLITTADKSTAIPKDGILTLSKEEKNNLFNTLQKNAPKLEIKSYPVKNNLSLIFNNKLPSDNKKESNSTLDKENESYRLSITDIEQMKKDYENLQKKFEEQQRIVKLLLDNNNITDSNGISHKENLSKLIPNYHNKGHITTKKEIFEDVHKVIDKVIENPVYKDSLDLLSSALVDG